WRSYFLFALARDAESRAQQRLVCGGDERRRFGVAVPFRGSARVLARDGATALTSAQGMRFRNWESSVKVIVGRPGVHSLGSAASEAASVGGVIVGAELARL